MDICSACGEYMELLCKDCCEPNKEAIMEHAAILALAHKWEEQAQDIEGCLIHAPSNLLQDTLIFTGRMKGLRECAAELKEIIKNESNEA